MSAGGQGPKTVSFHRLPQLYYPERTFRPNTPMYKQDMQFIFLNGGMGDYICWMPAIKWLCERALWLRGRLIIPTYFKELAEYWLRDYPEWTHVEYKNLDQIPKVNETPFRGPMELARESLNATGAHLLNCGWVYFTNHEKAPLGVDSGGRSWDTYRHFEPDYLAGIALPEAMHGLDDKKFAVITTGETTNSRRTPPGAWNPIVTHLLECGLTPVFLGKSIVETGNAKNIHAAFPTTTNYSLGVDLRDKTSLTQAAAIMQRSAVVIGHDNGLLHLAGCTQAPIVFGYNLASPDHRRPRRPEGRIYDVCLDHPETTEKPQLNCNFCQSTNNFVVGYNFRECFYRDLKCMELLFADGARMWLDQIDNALANPL